MTVNATLCTKCDQWIRGRCSKLKKVTPSSARFLVCSKCEKATNGEVQQEVMCDVVETVKGFCYLGNKLNASGECEAAVTARARVGWKKFRECGEILFNKKRFSLQMKKRYRKAKLDQLCYNCYMEVKHGV